MSEREQILGRIREALRVPAPRPIQKHGQGTPHGSAGIEANVRSVLSPGASTLEERLELFRTKALELRADFKLVNSPEQMSLALQQIRDAEKWQKIGCHAGQLTDLICGSLGLPMCRTESGYDVNELEKCSAGISECDALVAQTGSVLVTARSAGGRALSVLPPHHVVLARRSQMLGDLPDAFALLKEKYGKNYPSFISFITGPSRTGDIERILVLGAHGPKKLTIVCY